VVDVLIPRLLGGSFGAPDGMFRFLACRANHGAWCGATWTANDARALGRHLLERETHEAICSTGALADLAH
jgi:hypothetical protein